MFVLFVLLSFLEDCGYMARVAFVMDRVFRRFGLSGKSFIPMLVSTGCGVPGVLATKTIENEKDRRMTVMTTTFIPCGAKLPVIALVMGALIGDAESTWIAPLFYFLGVFAVIVSGIMLKKTRLFAGCLLYTSTCVSVIEGAGTVNGEPVEKGSHLLALAACDELLFTGDMTVITSHL